MAALRGDGLRAAILFVRMKGIKPTKQRKTKKIKFVQYQYIS